MIHGYACPEGLSADQMHAYARAAVAQRDEQIAAMQKDQAAALRAAHDLTLETQTVEEAVVDLVRMVRESRAEVEALRAKRVPLTDEQRRALVSRIVGFDPIGIITAERIVVETERAHAIDAARAEAGPSGEG